MSVVAELRERILLDWYYDEKVALLDVAEAAEAVVADSRWVTEEGPRDALVAALEAVQPAGEGK